jgi:hypothetical protein
LDGSVVHVEGRWANGEKDKDPEGKANVGVVFGPQYGPITAMQVEESIRRANRRGYDHLVLAGFSFDGASQAVIAEAQHPRMKIHAANIRPDVNPGRAQLSNVEVRTPVRRDLEVEKGKCCPKSGIRMGAFIPYGDG